MKRVFRENFGGKRETEREGEREMLASIILNTADLMLFII